MEKTTKTYKYTLTVERNELFTVKYKVVVEAESPNKAKSLFRKYPENYQAEFVGKSKQPCTISMITKVEDDSKKKTKQTAVKRKHYAILDV